MTRALAMLLAAVAVIAFTLPTVVARKVDQADVQLKAAIKKEVVDGDLKAAIELYRKIAQGSDRAVAARALIRMGQCYEKLGDAEATKAYQRVLKEFADQAEVVVEARTRLSALAGAAGAPAASTMTVRLVGEFMVNGVSPDGRYAAIQDDKGLVIRDLSTGQTRLLRGIDKGARYYPWSAFSPDGRQLAYDRYPEDAASQPQETWVSGIDGSNPRVLVSTAKRDGWDEYITYGWTPDGGNVLVLFARVDESFEIRLVSTIDGSARVIGTLDPRNVSSPPRQMSVSPDGRYIAFDYSPRFDTREHDIFLMPASGGPAAPLIDHPANDAVLGWAPDGKHLVFSSDRGGTWDAWLVSVEAGRAQGLPVLIQKRVGPDSVRGFTKQGAFYYRGGTPENEVYVATLDLEQGKILVQPAPPARRFTGGASPDWSPDGRYLVYIRPRTAVRDRPVVVIWSAATGEERDVTVSSDLTSLYYTLRWSPDGRSLLAAGFAGAGRLGTHVINLRGDVTASVRANTGDWCSDGRSIVTARNGEKFNSLFVRNLASGQYLEIYASGTVGPFISVSRDGRWLAFSAVDPNTAAGPGRPSSTLKIMPASGGETRDLLKLEYPQSVNSIAWTPDGRRLLFVRDNAEDIQKVELWSIPVNGGKPQGTGIMLSPMSQISIHPDGRRIAYNVMRSRNELWVIENFLPTASKGR